MAALRAGLEMLLAGFDALSGVPYARAPEESADSLFDIFRKLLCSNVRTFQTQCQWFWNQHEAVVNPSLMVWNLQEVAAKPVTHFSI